MLVLSTGEKSLAEFIGKSLQEGARKRLVDVPAEVQPGSAFETIPREQIHIESKRLFDAMKRHHGAVGRDWQRHLVDIGPDKIKAELHEHREAFLALPEVVASPRRRRRVLTRLRSLGLIWDCRSTRSRSPIGARRSRSSISSQAAPKARARPPPGSLRETAHASVLVLSTGEKSLAEFIGKSLQEGARKRLVDVPAEVQPGSAFETIPREQIHIESKRLFDAMKRQHGAVGREWQRHLVDIGPDKIKAELHEHREAFLALPEVVAVAAKAHPQVRAVVNRFALHAAALRMAIAAGLLPWTVEEADMGIVACMGRWVAQRGNVDTAGEVMRAAREVERKLAAGLGDQFIHINKSKTGNKLIPATEADEAKAKTPEHFDGFIKSDHVLIRPEAWRRYCDGVEPAEIARHFLDRGVLVPGDNGSLSKSQQVIGGSGRFYVLRMAALTL